MIHSQSSAIDLITILGPTASGKTYFASALAAALGTEIISADSRQIYRGMTIGTGKDLDDYIIDGKQVPYHLIDICDAGEKYNVFEYQRDFFEAYRQIKEKGLLPVLCGGTGLYIESVLKAYKLLAVPENPELREQLKNKSTEELKNILQSYKTLHNTTDLDSAKRAIRAIEIEEYYLKQQPGANQYQPLNSLTIGINIDRETRRNKISLRLKKRLEEGMIEEVRTLLNSGISGEDLEYYGLEYKYLTQYITGRLNYQEMYTQLETAIHQFAKRQMTWFRGMERKGFHIHWIDAHIPTEEKINRVKALLKSIYNPGLQA